ncbi:MAG: DNA polymerase I [Anaerolineae bacterium]|nr:DNA polymerase I [Anaerolineae bacterium]
MPKTLYLIDGHALAYRAYFAMLTTGSRFQTTSGEPTAATFGFTNILMSILEKDKPDYLAVAFDTGKTFRNDRYPEYKATRAKMPDDLIVQVERIRQVVDAFNIPRLEKEGFEADDVLGSVARQAAEKGLGVKIVTGDRDLLQLVDERIVVNLAGGKLSEAQDFFAEDVVKKMGVKPSQVVDLKALIGDTSDNIPGVKGIGEKTAGKLLEQYPTLDDIYAHLGEIPGRTGKLLEEGKESAYLSYDLAKIHTDLDVQLDLEQARTDNMDISRVTDLFRELQFRTLTSRLETLLNKGVIGSGAQLALFGEEPVKLGLPPKYELNVTVVDSEEKLKDLQAVLKNARQISFDTETTSTDPMRASLVGISLAVETGSAYYIPVGHVGSAAQLPVEKVLDALRPAFTDALIPKIGHNLKYDCLSLRCAGLEVAPLTFDTMIAAWVAEPDSRRLGLKAMAESELNISMTHIEELIGKGSRQLTMDMVAIEDVAPYAGADAEIPLRLMPILKKRLEDQNLLTVFEKIEMPLIPVLIDMEYTGIAVDAEFLTNYSKELSRRMLELQKEIYKLVGYDFNINSTQQLSKALFETLHLTPPDSGNKTKSGQFSTAAGVLDEMKDQHKVVELLLEFREISKLVSTYLEALPKQINPRTGRVHTSFNQTGSVTGRLASSDPNLQNIPTRTELGNQVRRGFIAVPGTLLLSVDYSQIELRIVAHMANDQSMLAAFRAGQDIHATTAAAIYGVPLEQVTKEQRRHAKAINFGLIYGMSAFGLSRSTDLTLAEAENFVKAYFTKFPGVKAYLDGIRKQAAERGYVETMLGRRRYFPELRNPPTPQVRARAEREAINAPIQGTAADILKVAMIRLPDELKRNHLSSRMLLQVHDELLLECPKDELQKTVEVVSRTMQNAYQLSIPLETDAAWGSNWSDLHGDAK